jgi:hypothetical protein
MVPTKSLFLKFRFGEGGLKPGNPPPFDALLQAKSWLNLASSCHHSVHSPYILPSMKLTLDRQCFVKYLCTEFHENPT